MRRTVKYTVFNAKAINIVEGKLSERELLPVKNTGRRLNNTKAKEKLFIPQLKEGEKVVVYKEDEVEKTYEMDLDTFIQYAKEI